MLKEVHSTKQIAGEPRRRWFVSAALDLYVWYDEEDAVIQFQICYDKGPGERALTWRREEGFSHHTVDDGESGIFQMKSSPILTARAGFDPANLRSLFAEAARKLEHDLYEFVINQLERSNP